MSINGISSSSYIAPSTVITGTQNAQANSASDPDGDGDGGVKRSRGHGHGQMQAALMQALQSLGLSAPQQAANTSQSASTTNSQTSNSTDSDGDTDGSASGASSVKNDMRQFMHALFQAVKSEATSSTDHHSCAPPPIHSIPLCSSASHVSTLFYMDTSIPNSNLPVKSVVK